jgi:hypothetical protein
MTQSESLEYMTGMTEETNADASNVRVGRKVSRAIRTIVAARAGIHGDIFTDREERRETGWR